MTHILLCGGSGTRLWPISRTLMPKQFVKLFEGRSLYQLTQLRNAKVAAKSLIVSNDAQYFLAIDQSAELGGHSQQRYILEPVGRNTAPAIALACFDVADDEVVLVTPADHLIKDEAAYVQAVERAKVLAEAGHLVTFGIKPAYPETGFGYIEAEGENVRSFKEKPDAQTAQSYIDAGNFYWNSGMFCFKAGVFLQELETHAPEIYAQSKAAYERAHNDGMLRVKHDDMIAIPEESIDYAVMERSDKIKVVSADIGWSDVGSFDALDAELPKDHAGNTHSAKLLAIDAHDNLVIASDRTVAAVDVDDLIIVDTPDALLINRKGSSQKVKEVVARLKQSGSELHHIHLTAHRPWGTYTVLEDTPGYKIKRIVVKPGKRLSLQKHYHRSEHWIVVSGTALVTVGTEEILVRPNESTYIPMGTAHRLENPGKIDLILIEAQVGEYTGEDDIVRLQDDFKRC
ncbi:MAG: mannose-1-phosphate guanylyltransferase/mannose-6-phosphate isomerase [Campylobacterales bacterium]|nr:mannose-1-phosphate guanylyltransferase/mannose-6-phosphate isomerase [Campylobacterales bacterium]